MSNESQLTSHRATALASTLNATLLHTCVLAIKKQVLLNNLTSVMAANELEQPNMISAVTVLLFSAVRWGLGASS